MLTPIVRREIVDRIHQHDSAVLRAQPREVETGRPLLQHHQEARKLARQCRMPLRNSRFHCLHWTALNRFYPPWRMAWRGAPHR
jgi:hypothetical protein